MTKKTVIALRGLPASGKTTFVLEQIANNPESTVRINNDDLVVAIYGATNTERRETSAETLKALREEMLRTFLALPHIETIYIDNTNLNVQTVRSLEKITRLEGHNFVVDDRFMKVPVEDCINRDSKRANPVGESVIRKMEKQAAKSFSHCDWSYINAPEIVPYDNNYFLPSVVICDLDGTIADGTGRRDIYDYSKVYSDRINRIVLEDVIGSAAGDEIVFMSGRPDSCRTDTERWIRDALNLCGYGKSFRLYMRNSSDYRQDWIVKYELFQEHIAGKNKVRCVWDDRTQVVKMWRRLGLQTYQVSDGNF